MIPTVQLVVLPARHVLAGCPLFSVGPLSWCLPTYAACPRARVLPVPSGRGLVGVVRSGGAIVGGR